MRLGGGPLTVRMGVTSRAVGCQRSQHMPQQNPQTAWRVARPLCGGASTQRATCSRRPAHSGVDALPHEDVFAAEVDVLPVGSYAGRFAEADEAMAVLQQLERFNEELESALQSNEEGLNWAQGSDGAFYMAVGGACGAMLCSRTCMSATLAGFASAVPCAGKRVFVSRLGLFLGRCLCQQMH
jgi:hypothetical protein